jgi:hypothetical protein
VERPPKERAKRGIGWFGVPTMIGLLVIAAGLRAVHGLGGLIIAAVGVVVVVLVIGALMTMTAR